MRTAPIAAVIVGTTNSAGIVRKRLSALAGPKSIANAHSMAMKTTGFPDVDALYRVRKGNVDLVDVPEFGFVSVDGGGSPDGQPFADAIQALYSVSYRAHFTLKKARGEAPRVMALEALWWVEGSEAEEVMRRIAAGHASMDSSDRADWRWRLMIAQLPPLEETIIQEAITEAKAKKSTETLDRVRFERWAEGPSAQILHVGPYATEQLSVIALHQSIADRGLRPRGQHHEIYLGDPRNAAPEKLRTILRQPVEPVP